jgi:hypothetical protein
MKIYKPKLAVGSEFSVDIVKGVYVMLDNGAESFWVHIAQVMANLYLGIVCSRLKKSRSYNFGDVIQIQKQNILQVHT